MATEGILVSRPESLDRVGAVSVGTLSCFTLQRAAEVEIGTDIAKPAIATSEGDRVPEGLHAKTLVLDIGERSRVITGSANATTAGFRGNVEFSVLLEGPRKTCGVSSMWDGSNEAPGLSCIVQSHELADIAGETDPGEATAWEVDAFHASLCRKGLTALIEPLDDAFRLTLTVPALESPGRSAMWPISLSRDVYARDLIDATPLVWGPVGVRSVTPFVAVQTTAGTGDARVTRTAVIKAELIGDPEDRKRDALRDVLRTKEDVLRYLVFLLGDPAYEQWFGHGDDAETHPIDGFGPVRQGDLAVFEPLVRAAVRDEQAIHRVAALLRDIGDLPEHDIVPDGFADIWQAVWAATRKEPAHED